MIDVLKLSHQLLNEMISYVAQHAPLEACGILAGKEGQAEKMIGVLNQAKSPTRFVMEPYEQLRAFDWVESHNLDIVGIFHSHPTGPETVSATDIAEAAYDVVYVILSYKEGQWLARGFWIENGGHQEVALELTR